MNAASNPQFSVGQPMASQPDSLCATGIAPTRRGRPAGAVSLGVAEVLRAGGVAGIEALAQKTGWPPERVRVALIALMTAGRVGAVGAVDRPARAARAGRPRVAYAWQRSTPTEGGLAWAMQEVGRVWR